MEEIWKDIKGYEGYYQISNLGRVKSLSRKYSPKERILKNQYDKDGYYEIGLTKNKKKQYFRVHRLVAQAFIFNIKNKPQVNHKNGIKDDNRVENLEWCTNQENEKHAYNIGLKHALIGENNGSSKLTEKQVRIIKYLLKNSDLKQKEIGEIFNVSIAIISCIKLNKRWKQTEVDE